MGLKGNLSTVNLADVFQVLSRGNSTGLLRIQAPEGPRFVEIQNGQISIAGRSAGRILLGDLLLSRGLLDEPTLETALQMQRESGKLLGQVLIDQNIVALQNLEEALRFQIEEEVCELFTLGKGDFDFLAGATLDAKIAPGGGLVKLKIDPNSLLLEAARRADEWKGIEQRIPNQAFLFQLTPQGAELLQSGTGLSAEGLVLLRLVHENRSVEAMVQKACMGRLNTNQMLLELWDAGIILPMPIEQYEKAARSHLRLNRIDEAQRVLDYVALIGGADMRTKCQAALAEIEKAKKAAISGSMNATGDPKIRSEVIRRNQPGLILKKERSILPLVAGALAVLLAAGAGAYFAFFSKKQIDTTERKLFNEQLEQVQREMTAENYAKALELLRGFHSTDPETQKLASQKYEAERKNVEVLLAKALTDFNTAYTKGPPEALKTATGELEKFAKLDSLSGESQQELTKARTLLNQVKNREKLEATRIKLREIDAVAKTKTSDALKEAYEAVLAENPPEEIAAEVRERLSKLVRARLEAEQRLQLAELERNAGETDGAKVLLEQVRRDGPGTDYSARGAAGIEAVDKQVAEVQKRLDKVDIMQAQKLTEEARTELKKIIDSHPPERLLSTALDSLTQLESKPETELETQFRAAKALVDTRPAEARKYFLDLLAKAPYSRVAAGVMLRVNATSEPANAEVTVNGRSAGKTPVAIDVPAIGLAHITFKKAGFETRDVIESNFRGETLAVNLLKNPAMVRSMPAPAAGGLAVNSEYAVLLTATEASICAPNDLHVLSRVGLRQGEDQKSENALPGAAILLAQGSAFADLADKGIARVKLTSGDYAHFTLSANATSSPLPYATKELPGRKLIAVSTETGLDVLDSEDGKIHKSVPVGNAGSRPWGLAADGDLFYIPSEHALTAVFGYSGDKKWNTAVDDKVLAGPALASGRGTLALVTESGQLLGFDAESGTKKFQRELGAKPAPFVVSTANGILTVLKDGKTEFSASDKGGALWSAELKGEPLAAPAIVRPSEKDPESAFVFCTQAGDNYEVIALSNAGVLLWHARLISKPLSMTAFGEKIYVATANAELSIFDLN